MTAKIVLDASSREIDVLIVIDTEFVKNKYPNPSQDPNAPTGIDHAGEFMLCTGSRGPVVGQGTADLKFQANPGDIVSFAATSIYANSDDAVIVYGINYWSGDHVFNTFVPNVVVRRGAAVPDPDTMNGLPAMQVAVNFASFGAKVKAGGTENFYVFFALYVLGADGETQNLFGYFYWDPTIVVS